MEYKKAFVVDTSEIEGRLDPFYYKVEFLELEERLKRNNFQYLSKLTNKITDGTHFTPTYTDSGIKFISVKDINDFKINFNKTKFISKEEHTKLIKRCNPETNDILLTKIGSIGRIAFVDESYEEFSLFVSVALLKPKHNLIKYKYLGYLLTFEIISQQIKRVLKGIGVNDFHLEDIKKLKIPLPPKETQTKIIQIMDNAYKIKEENEKRAKELLASINNYLLDKLDITLPKKEKIVSFEVNSSDIFGSRFDPFYYKKVFLELNNLIKSIKYVKLKQIALIKGGKRIPKGKRYSEVKTNYKYLKVKNINKDIDIDIDELSFITKATYQEIKNYKIEVDDIIISNAGTIGKIVIFKNETNYKVILTENAVRVIVSSSLINNLFLKVILEHRIVQSQLSREFIQTTIPKLSIERIKNLTIPLPPLPIQNEIANHIEELRRESNELKEKAQRVLKDAKDEVERIILG